MRVLNVSTADHNSVKSCPKCGTETYDNCCEIEFVQSGKIIEYIDYYLECDGLKYPENGIGFLRITCNKCRFHWLEETKDA